MDYFLICFASILFSLQFLFQKNYKEKYGSSLGASLLFQIYTALSGIIILLIIHAIKDGKFLEFSWFSLTLGTVYSLVGIGYTIVAAKALDSADLTLFSMFAMLGGMLIPFVFGIAVMGDDFTLGKIIGCVLILVSLFLSSVNFGQKVQGKSSGKNLIYYILVFIFNGLVGVLSTIHQSAKYSEVAVDSYSFMIWTKILALIISAVILLFLKYKIEKPTVKIVLLTSCYSAVNSIGNLFLVIALLTLQSSVQYPIVTGGTIILSFIITSVQEKRINKKLLICAVISLVATVLFIF